MKHQTSFVARPEHDETGEELSAMLGQELSFLSDEGLDGFMLVPVQNDGRTVGVIIAARGEPASVSKSLAEGRAAFKELMGLNIVDWLNDPIHGPQEYHKALRALNEASGSDEEDQEK